MKDTARIEAIVLSLVALLLYAAQIVVFYQTALPYSLLATLGILFLDLFLWSPLKAGCAAVCYFTAIENSDTPSFLRYGFSQELFYKAVTLRATIWRKRTMRYALLFLPSAYLCIISERYFEASSAMHNTQIVGFIGYVCAWSLLIIGIVCVEIRLLRYQSAWYLLPVCQNAAEAIRASKTLSICHLEDIVHLTITHPFLCVHSSFAQWVVSQIQQSRHAYNFTENTNTVTGTRNAHTLSDGGNKYERA